MQVRFLLSLVFIFSIIGIHDACLIPRPELKEMTFHFSKKANADIPFWETGKKKDLATDTASLKQSNWFAETMKSIETKEYDIHYQEEYKTYSSPNRQNNLRAFYSTDKFTLAPRNDSADKWKLTLQLKGIYAGKELLYTPVKDPVVTNSNNTIRFNNNDQFITEYVNSKEGVRQNFIISRKPAGDPKQLSVQLEVNKNWYIDKVDKKEIHFAKANKKGYDNKITYNGLKVWDANNKELVASFSVHHDKISIDVNTSNAVYPITVDPISTTPAAIVESNQDYAFLGFSVASAGDVNQDAGESSPSMTIR